jgi:hypothetical protein
MTRCQLGERRRAGMLRFMVIRQLRATRLTGPPMTCSPAIRSPGTSIDDFKPSPQAMRELTSLPAPGTGRR